MMIATTTTTALALVSTEMLTPLGILVGVLTFGVLIFQLVLLEMGTKDEMDEGFKKRRVMLFILTPLLFSFIVVLTYSITRFV